MLLQSKFPLEERKRHMLGKHVTIVVGRMLILALIVATTDTGRAAAASGVDQFQTNLNGAMPPGTEGLNLSFTVRPARRWSSNTSPATALCRPVSRGFSRSLP